MVQNLSGGTLHAQGVKCRSSQQTGPARQHGECGGAQGKMRKKIIERRRWLNRALSILPDETRPGHCQPDHSTGSRLGAAWCERTAGKEALGTPSVMSSLVRECCHVGGGNWDRAGSRCRLQRGACWPCFSP